MCSFFFLLCFHRSGDGIDAAGFSYRAEDLSDSGIYYYNPGWVDMDIPSLERMVEVVQIMSFHTERAHKVAVHCFAEGHEILTNRGFVDIHTLRAYVDAEGKRELEPLLFATLNRHTNQIEYQEAEDFIFNVSTQEGPGTAEGAWGGATIFVFSSSFFSLLHYHLIFLSFSVSVA